MRNAIAGALLGLIFVFASIAFFFNLAPTPSVPAGSPIALFARRADPDALHGIRQGLRAQRRDPGRHPRNPTTRSAPAGSSHHEYPRLPHFHRRWRLRQSAPDRRCFARPLPAMGGAAVVCGFRVTGTGERTAHQMKPASGSVANGQHNDEGGVLARAPARQCPNASTQSVRSSWILVSCSCCS